jgi:hypothetical protein
LLFLVAGLGIAFLISAGVSPGQKDSPEQKKSSEVIVKDFANVKDFGAKGDEDE